MDEVSREYAVALFELAKESNSEREFFNALKLISDIFSENPEYSELLSSPLISQDERERAVSEAFRNNVPRDILSFLQIICQNGNIRYFKNCFSEYEKMYMRLLGHTAATVISAVPLSQEEKELIKNRLEKMSGRSVTLSCTVDESIIGGIIIEMDGKTINGSIKQRLTQIKKVIDK